MVRLNRHRLVILALTLSLIISLGSGVGFGANKKIRIGFSQYTLAGTPWWTALVESAKKEAAKNGAELFVVDGHDSISKQVSDIEDLIAKGCDVIIVNPKDPVGIIPAAKAVHKAKIPLIAVDTPMDPAANPITTVLSDNTKIGFLTGWELAKAVGKKDAKVVVMSAQPGDKCGEARRHGFFAGFIEYQLEKYNSTGFTIVQQGWGNWSYDEAQKEMEDIITAHPKIDVVFAENDAMAIGALIALKEAGRAKGVFIGGIDGQKEIYELIKKGEAHATGLNSPDILGVEVIRTALKILKGETVPSVVHTPADVITKANVDKYYNPKSIF